VQPGSEQVIVKVMLVHISGGFYPICNYFFLAQVEVVLIPLAKNSVTVDGVLGGIDAIVAPTPVAIIFHANEFRVVGRAGYEMTSFQLDANISRIPFGTGPKSFGWGVPGGIIGYQHPGVVPHSTHLHRLIHKTPIPIHCQRIPPTRLNRCVDHILAPSHISNPASDLVELPVCFVHKYYGILK
jgi:hypothetical protein